MGAPSSPPTFPSRQPPPAVTSLATSRGLGDLTMARKGENPVTNLLFCFGGAAALFALSALLGWLAGLTGVRALALGAVLCILAGLFAVALGFYMLMQGFRATYVYTHGLVWTHNGRVESATWAEVDRLVLQVLGNSEPTAALVITLDGREALVASKRENGVDVVLDHLERAFRHFGRAVLTNAEVIAERADAGEIAGPPPNRFVAFAMLAAGVTVAVLLHLIGVPGPVSAFLGFFLIGVALTAAGIWTGQRVAKIGQVFLIISGIILLAVSVVGFGDEVNGFIVAGVVLALEAGAVALWRVVYRRTPAPRSLAARQKLAARMGWQFQAQATVPVAGPRTAARLIGVATGAPGTVADAVATGTANGLGFLVCERVRRRPMLGDPTQTVWMISLPFPLPYIASTATDALNSPALAEHAASAELAQVVATSPAVSGSRLGGPAPWWIEGSYLYCAQEAVPIGALAPRVEQLSRLAAQLPWQELQRFTTAAR